MPAINISKCQSLQVGSRNIANDYEMCGVKVISVHSVKDLGVTVESDFKYSSSATSPLKKKKTMMGLNKRYFSFKNKDVVLPLHRSNIFVNLIYSMPCSFGFPTMRKTLLD